MREKSARVLAAALLTGAIASATAMRNRVDGFKDLERRQKIEATKRLI